MKCPKCSSKNKSSNKYCNKCGFLLSFELSAFKKMFGKRYTIEKEIGRGGMAVVFKGRDKSTKRPVAIKLLLNIALHGDFIIRFRREFQSMKTLEHQNIVSVFDFLEMDTYCFYIMEFIDGKNLKQYYHENPVSNPEVKNFSLKLKKFLESIGHLCDGLDYIHKHGFIHRDVKPSNIMITSNDQVKLMDFGLVKSRDFSISLTRTGIISGTVAYMSPEQAQGKSLDLRTDIYSLGVILFEIVTDSLPFFDENPINLLIKHMHDPPPVPLKINPRIPAELNRIILKCLNKDPQLRFQNTLVLKESLLRIFDRQYQEQQQTDKIAGQESISSSGIRNLLQPKFVGRSQELSYLNRLLKDVERGKGKSIIVRGGKGIGKTKLIQEMKNEGLIKNLRFFHGIAYSRDEIPYKPFTDIVEQFARYASLYDSTTSPDLSSKNMLPINKILSTISKEIDKTKTDNIAVKTYFIENRSRIFEIFLRFFKTLSKENPLILFLDNFHLADENSLLLFSYLTKHLTRSKTLIITAIRSDELASQEKEPAEKNVMEYLLRYRTSPSIIELGGLSMQQIAEMIRGMLGIESISTEVTTLIFHRSRGNPLIAQETLKNLLEEHVFTFSDAGWTEKAFTGLDIPHNFTQLLNLRLNRLNEAQWRFLSIASILGTTFDVSFLFEVEKYDAESGAKLIFELCNEGFLSEIQSSLSDLYSFVHEEMCFILNSLLSEDEKKYIHAAVLTRMLKRAPEEQEIFADKLYHHAINSEGHTVRAAYFARLAGDRYVKQYALQSAKFYYHQAEEILLTLAQDTVVGLELFSIYQSMAQLYHFLGENRNSSRSYFRALEVARKLQEPQLISECLINTARFFRTIGDYKKAALTLEKTLDITKKSQLIRQQAQSLSAMGELRSLQNQHEHAAEALSTALRLFRSLKDEQGEIQALIHYGRAYSRISEREQAIELFQHAYVNAQQNHHVEYMWQGLCALSEEFFNCGRLDEARDSALHAVEMCTSQGTKKMIAQAHMYVGLCSQWSGDYSQANQAFKAASDIYEELDEMTLYLSARIQMSKNLIYLTEYNKALYLIEEMHRHYSEHLSRKVELQLTCLLSHCYLETGLDELLQPLENAITALFTAVQEQLLPEDIMMVGDFYTAIDNHKAIVLYQQVAVETRKQKLTTLNLAAHARIILFSIKRKKFKKIESTVPILLAQLEKSQLYPYIGKIHYYLGSYYGHHGNSKKALIELNRAKALAAERNFPYYFWRASFLLGQLYARQEQMPEAIPHYRDSQRVVHKIITAIKPKFRKKFLQWLPIKNLLSEVERIDSFDH